MASFTILRIINPSTNNPNSRIFTPLQLLLKFLFLGFHFLLFFSSSSNWSCRNCHFCGFCRKVDVEKRRNAERFVVYLYCIFTDKFDDGFNLKAGFFNCSGKFGGDYGAKLNFGVCFNLGHGTQIAFF